MNPSFDSADHQANSPSQDNQDSGEDPYSPGLQPLTYLLGGLIGLLSVAVPLATVLAGRPVPSGSYRLHGSEPATSIPSARAGEFGGGDPSRLPQ
jgi:hypothetical protein